MTRIFQVQAFGILARSKKRNPACCGRTSLLGTHSRGSRPLRVRIRIQFGQTKGGCDPRNVNKWLRPGQLSCSEPRHTYSPWMVSRACYNAHRPSHSNQPEQLPDRSLGSTRELKPIHVRCYAGGGPYRHLPTPIEPCQWLNDHRYFAFDQLQGLGDRGRPRRTLG
jgi:hypothetical protein